MAEVKAPESLSRRQEIIFVIVDVLLSQGDLPSRVSVHLWVCAGCVTFGVPEAPGVSLYGRAVRDHGGSGGASPCCVRAVSADGYYSLRVSGCSCDRYRIMSPRYEQRREYVSMCRVLAVMAVRLSGA